jgi:hypothetical protein
MPDFDGTARWKSREHFARLRSHGMILKRQFPEEID